MAEMLRPNEHLDEITFQETSDPQKLWTSLGRGAFSEMMKDCTKLKRVNIKFQRENLEDDQVFEKEVRFYSKNKSKHQAKLDEYKKVLRSCDPSQMFENLSKMIENNENQSAEMPVRKFYNNTFNTLLNRAIFALIKKQQQNPTETQYFTTEGMVKFVAFQLLDSPPDGELEQNVNDDDSV